MLYIILFLHQTTTSFPQWFVGTKLYIVLFLHQTTTLLSLYPHPAQLYIVLFLHQTTTPWGLAQSLVRLYIVLFLHQTTTPNEHYRINPRLYIVLFLHQTTTIRRNCRVNNCCISYYSYIKPQPSGKKIAINAVVYRTIPTSNHNSFINHPLGISLYIVLFLHQTTTMEKIPNQKEGCISYYSYIKPQHEIFWKCCHNSCISYYSYIKPQLAHITILGCNSCISYYSYIKPQPLVCSIENIYVVYRTIPTSNHN